MATPSGMAASSGRFTMAQTRKLFDDPLISRPLVICLGPVPVLFFLWIFFAVTFNRPLAVRDYLAPLVDAHFQSATMIISVFATILASYVSFFFSLAVRYVIAVRLAATSTSLDFLNSATRIAQKSLWVHDPRVKWTWIVLLAYIGVTVQTSALTAFLNVREIQFSHNLSGSDLDLSDPRLLQMSNNTDLPDTYDALASFFLQSVMIDSMLVRRNASSTFNFNGYTYLSTTGGIHPASYVPIHNQHFTSNASVVVPANLNDVSKSKHFTLPFNKTMELVQQGFTADVNCRLGDPRDNATYSPTLVGGRIGTSPLAMVVLNATCPGAVPGTTQAGPVVYNVLDTLNSGGLLGVSCQIPGTNSYDIIMRATGAYAHNLDWMTCTVAPKTTFVNVAYTLSPQNPTIPTAVDVSSPLNQTDVPLWGRFAVEMLLYNMVLGQSTIGSTMGNAWLFGPGAVPDISFAEALNLYIRAGVEFTGTVIRQLWTQPGNPVAQLPLNSSVYTPIHGSFFATTYGWQQSHDVAPLLLLPTTVIIIATYCITIYGFRFARRHRNHLHEDDLDFDPTNIVHVVAAHAPETRKDFFQSFSSGSTHYMKQTAVRMQSRQGVRAFEVSAVPASESSPRYRDKEGDRDSDDLKIGPDQAATTPQ